MSGMDRLTDEALERRANTALSGLGPVHGRLLTEGYEGSANSVMDAADVIRELLAHRRASQAAPAPSDGLREENERPDGAIHNGRCFMDRIEADYSFECVAGPISNCADWHELRRCFEHMASYIAAPSDGLREALEAISNAYTAHGYVDAGDAVQDLKDIARAALEIKDQNHG